MGYTSVSDAIADVLDGMHFLRDSLRLGLVNYSALARMIKPIVVEKVGSDVGLDAIAIAIRRYSAIASNEKPFSDLYSVVNECKIDLQGDMVTVQFKRSDELFQKLIHLERSVNYESGEKMYIVQRSDSIGVISMSRFLPKLLDLSNDDAGQILFKAEDLALVTVNTPQMGVHAVGVISFFSRQFEYIGVPVVDVFSSFGRISFLFNEADAPAVYARLANAVSESNNLAKFL